MAELMAGLMAELMAEMRRSQKRIHGRTNSNMMIYLAALAAAGRQQLINELRRRVRAGRKKGGEGEWGCCVGWRGVAWGGLGVGVGAGRGRVG